MIAARDISFHYSYTIPHLNLISFTSLQLLIVMDHNKLPKHKLRTLCTIDTSDIELNDFRNNNHKKNMKKNNRLAKEEPARSHSRVMSRATPTSSTPLNFKQIDSPYHQKKRSMSKKMNKTMNRSRMMT